MQYPTKPIFTFLHDRDTVPNSGVCPLAPQPTPAYGQGPYRRPPYPDVPPLALSVANNLARQAEGINVSVTHMDADARRLLTQSRNNEDVKRQATRQMADDILVNPVTNTPPPMVVDESRANVETDGG